MLKPPTGKKVNCCQRLLCDRAENGFDQLRHNLRRTFHQHHNLIPAKSFRIRMVILPLAVKCLLLCRLVVVWVEMREECADRGRCNTVTQCCYLVTFHGLQFVDKRQTMAALSLKSFRKKMTCEGNETMN